MDTTNTTTNLSPFEEAGTLLVRIASNSEECPKRRATARHALLYALRGLRFDPDDIVPDASPEDYQLHAALVATGCGSRPTVRDLRRLARAALGALKHAA